MMDCLLSIVIPTRNREIYCIEAIKSILGFDETCFELIIKDNSDSDELNDYVDGITDVRLKYFRTKGRINSVLNMADALSYAQGDYVCMIGDDDTVLPNIFSVVKWAKENGVKAVAPKLSYGFLWNLDKSMKGRLITHRPTNHVTKLKPQKQLSLLLKNGIIQYDKYDLPRLYHGLFQKEVLESIFEKTGHYIGGLSPDIYLSVASCFHIDEYYKIDFPFTIPGNCVQSTSVGNPRGKFDDMPHLWHRGNYEWNDQIPRYNSAQTIWAETALKAIEENDDDSSKWMARFNLKYFLTVFWLQNKDRHNEIINEVGDIHFVDYYSVVRYYIKRIPVRIKSLYNYLTGERKTFSELGSWNGVFDCVKKDIIYL